MERGGGGGQGLNNTVQCWKYTFKMDVTLPKIETCSKVYNLHIEQHDVTNEHQTFDNYPNSPMIASHEHPLCKQFKSSDFYNGQTILDVVPS